MSESLVKQEDKCFFHRWQRLNTRLPFNISRSLHGLFVSPATTKYGLSPLIVAAIAYLISQFSFFLPPI